MYKHYDNLKSSAHIEHTIKITGSQGYECQMEMSLKLVISEYESICHGYRVISQCTQAETSYTN